MWIPYPDKSILYDYNVNIIPEYTKEHTGAYSDEYTVEAGFQEVSSQTATLFILPVSNITEYLSTRVKKKAILNIKDKIWPYCLC